MLLMRNLSRIAIMPIPESPQVIYYFLYLALFSLFFFFFVILIHLPWYTVSADKFARINVLMLDLICWATKNCSRDFASCPNLLIISESSEEDTNFWPLIQGLSCRGYNTFVAAPDTGLHCRGIYAHRLALPWKILSSKGKRKDREDTVSDSDY